MYVLSGTYEKSGKPNAISCSYVAFSGYRITMSFYIHNNYNVH